METRGNSFKRNRSQNEFVARFQPQFCRSLILPTSRTLSQPSMNKADAIDITIESSVDAVNEGVVFQTGVPVQFSDYPISIESNDVEDYNNNVPPPYDNHFLHNHLQIPGSQRSQRSRLRNNSNYRAWLNQRPVGRLMISGFIAVPDPPSNTAANVQNSSPMHETYFQLSNAHLGYSHLPSDNHSEVLLPNNKALKLKNHIPTRTGFSRTCVGHNVYTTCPKCSKSLGIGEHEVQRSIWAGKCGHVYCGNCPIFVRATKVKTQAGRCVVQGCTRNIAGEKGLFELYL